MIFDDEIADWRRPPGYFILAPIGEELGWIGIALTVLLIAGVVAIAAVTHTGHIVHEQIRQGQVGP